MKRSYLLSLLLALIPAQALAQEEPPALEIDRAGEIVRLGLSTGEANDGLSFNGYSGGALQLIVPRGWTVEISLSNRDNFRHHSLTLIPAALSALADPAASLASSSASTTSPEEGLVPGERGLMRFTAEQEGEFYLACGVLDHAARGMWIRVVVAGEDAEPALSPAPPPGAQP